MFGAATDHISRATPRTTFGLVTGAASATASAAGSAARSSAATAATSAFALEVPAPAVRADLPFNDFASSAAEMRAAAALLASVRAVAIAGSCLAFLPLHFVQQFILGVQGIRHPRR